MCLPSTYIKNHLKSSVACAQQLLDDWCAMTDLERQEAIAFRDWYSPNIQP